MKTVYDLIRHRTALEVICTNCTNTKVVNNRFLTHRFGMTKLLVEIDFICHLWPVAALSPALCARSPWRNRAAQDAVVSRRL